MEWRTRFHILFVDKELHKENTECCATREIVKQLIQSGLSVLESRSHEDGWLAFLAHPNVSCVLVNWDMEAGGGDSLSSGELVSMMRRRNESVPILLFANKYQVSDIPLEVVRQINGYFWKNEDTPQFVAGRIEETARQYLDQLLPPFFGELVRYTEEYKYAWHTPGHTGGVAFLKSPVGQVFFDFFGENTLRSDLSVSVPELGSLMEHSGVVGQAEANAATVFGADKTYFVLNGTSTANQAVWHGRVNPGDIVLVDRNCHKSMMYAIIMTGAVPVYLIPTRNDYGIIGPVHVEELDSDNIRRKIGTNLLTKDRGDDPIKHATITNSTYDGLCYNVESIKDKLAGVVGSLHFDEAWYGYARFHPLYQGRYAMSRMKEDPDHPILFATQSTHKVLAAFSQGSMIHIRDGHKPEAQRVVADLFNEAFMMHTSTSPNYPIIASLDVASKMMQGDAGLELVADTMEEAIIFRNEMVRLKTEVERAEETPSDRWWFGVWQPAQGALGLGQPGTGLRSDSATATDKDFLKQLDYWTLNPGDTWHGFDGLEDDYMLLDPTKVTILTPGIGDDGTMEGMGIPAGVVSVFLRDRGVVVEKTGFYSFLILFTAGITKGKSGTLLAELFRFKTLHDQNEKLSLVFPDLADRFPDMYKGMGLRDLCQDMHGYLKNHKIASTMKDVYARIPETVVTPADAYREVVEGRVDKVPILDIMGKVAAVMVVPYPPGIPIWMPGEKLSPGTEDIRDYLALYEDFDNRYPGFETEIHGVVIEEEEGHKAYSIYCLSQDTCADDRQG